MKKTMVWIVLAALFIFTACGALAAGELALPAAEDLEEVSITASELELSSGDGGFISRLLEALEQSALEKTGRASVQDVPDKGAGLVRIGFRFREGGTGAVFLYREGEGLFLEQPYRGIYEMDGALEEQLRRQIALELARQYAGKQEG